MSEICDIIETYQDTKKTPDDGTPEDIQIDLYRVKEMLFSGTSLYYLREKGLVPDWKYG